MQLKNHNLKRLFHDCKHLKRSDERHVGHFVDLNLNLNLDLNLNLNLNLQRYGFIGNC